MKIIFFDFSGTIANTSLPKEKNRYINSKIIETIKKLGEDYTLMIISSSSQSSIKRTLKNTEIDHLFSEIKGYEARKNKTEKIKNILEIYPTTNSECLMVTDTVRDIKEAKKANVESIAVTWGLQGKSSFSKLKPYSIIDRPEELKNSIEKFFENSTSKNKA